MTEIFIGIGAVALVIGVAVLFKKSKGTGGSFDKSPGDIRKPK